jgi:glycosyltransferase involved in cell wall biosynthesis
MKKKKVLQICHGYDPPFLDVGNQYARLFDRELYEVSTLYLSGARSPLVEESTVADKVIFYELDSSSLKGLKTKIVTRLKGLMSTEVYDVVLCHRYKAIYLTALARRGLNTFLWIGVVHDFKVFSNLSRRLFVRLFGRGLNVLGVSDAIRDNVAHDCPLLANRVFSQPNGIDVVDLQEKQIDRRLARERLGLPQNGFIFGNVGRLHPVKDQETLLRAFAKVSDYLSDSFLVLMGEGKLEQELKCLAEELGLSSRVIFLGMVADGPNYFKTFDLFVLTSTKEPFGMVLIEAMAAGVPVISSKTGGTGDVVGDAGLLFEPGDVDKLAKLLAEAYHWDTESREEYISKANRRLEENFSLGAFRQRFWAFPFHCD